MIESNAKPENFITQIRGSTSPGKLKVIRLDFQNECQQLYGQFKPQDAILDFYIPIDGNKTITIKYNNVSYPHNSNLKIDKNPFDYTLKNFIIPGNKIIPNGIAEIWYDGKNIYNFTITYSNVVLPPLIQRIHRLNTYFPIPNPLSIRFSEPIKIGANEVRNRFHLCDGGRCVLQSDNITLKCDNPQIIDCLYYEGMCGTQAMDYYIEYYTPPHNSQYLSRKYYVLPGNKKLIHFYYEIGSENSTFPLKVYVNDEEVTIMKTLYGKRQYYYSTNKPGNYYIYVLDHNKILTGPVETVYVRNHISDFFPTFKSDNTCIYYNEEGTFRFMNNDFVDLNYIYAYVYKYHFSIFYCPFCFWNIYHYYHYGYEGSLNNQNGIIKYDTKYYYNGKYYYREGFVTLYFRSGNDKSNPLLHKEHIYFTDVRTPYVTYSFDMITISAICLLDNLTIKNYKTGQSYSLSCDNKLSRKDNIIVNQM